MIPNNNLSVLPFYTSAQYQNARKWWTYGRVYPLFTPAGFILPFQIITEHVENSVVREIYLFDANNDTNPVADLGATMRPMITKKEFAGLGYDVFVFPGQLPVINSLLNGRYYIRMQIGAGSTIISCVSEIFTVVNDIQPYLKIEWWDVADFAMDAGVIVYTAPAFKNVLYLHSDIAKPDYIFEEEVENRDGYMLPIKLISEKRYRFNFFASEYLLDVLRLVRLADYVQISKNGQVFSVDSFLITPEWQDNGDVAVVEAEFDVATVAKKIGLGYIKAKRGAFDDSFDDSFDNE